MLYVDYVVEVGLEDNVDVNKAVDELCLTDNQKYYLKMGCIITAAVLSVVFGYYIIKNYEIFKPEDSGFKPISINEEKEDFFINLGTLGIHDDNLDLEKIAFNIHNEKLLLNNLSNKEYHDSIKVEKIWEALEDFRTQHPSIIKTSLVEEITSENIKYYEVFMHHYNAFLDYMYTRDETNPVNRSVYKNLVSNNAEAFCEIPEVAKAVKE